jgi:DNA-binding ferritin-like protein
MLLQIAVHYRALYLFAVQAHHLAAKVAFFPDHAFFAEVYGQAEDFYDQLIERHIGLNGEEHVDLMLINQKATEILSQLKTKGVSENKEFYMEILKQLQATLTMLDQACKDPSVSVGTQNLLAGQADSLEVLVYKISRRVK